MTSFSKSTLAHWGNPVRYPKESVICVQRDKANKLYLIMEGIVKLSIFSEQGDERIIEFIKPERFLGAPDIFTGSLYGITATAYTDALVTPFSSEKAQKLFQEDRDFSACLVRSVSQHARSLGRQLVGDSFFPAAGRIGFALLNLAVQIGAPAGGHTVKLSITQNELSKYIGCNRVTVTNALSELATKGLIKKKNKSLFLPDPEALRKWLGNISNV